MESMSNKPTSSLHCARCNYSLAGLGIHRVCPECSLPVVLSAKRAKLLSLVPRNVERTAWLLSACMLALFFWMWAMILGSDASQLSIAAFDSLYIIAPICYLLIINLLLILLCKRTKKIDGVGQLTKTRVNTRRLSIMHCIVGIALVLSLGTRNNRIALGSLTTTFASGGVFWIIASALMLITCLRLVSLCRVMRLYAEELESNALQRAAREMSRWWVVALSVSFVLLPIAYHFFFVSICGFALCCCAFWALLALSARRARVAGTSPHALVVPDELESEEPSEDKVLGA